MNQWLGVEFGLHGTILFSERNLEILAKFISDHPGIAKKIDSEGKTLLHHAIIGIREQLLEDFLPLYRGRYIGSNCGATNPCEPPKSVPNHDGIYLKSAYATFLTSLISLNPVASHVKDNEEFFASDYVVQNTKPAPHTIVFTSLLSFLLQHRASIDSLLLSYLNSAKVSAQSEEANLAVVAKIEKPLHVFSMFKQHEKSTRQTFFSPSMFVNYLKHKIQLDTILLQILPLHLQDKAVLPLELLQVIIEMFSGLRPADSLKLGEVVQENYETRGIISRKV